MDAARKSFLARDGTKVSYLFEGTGPPVLLLHGFVSAAKSWWKIGLAQRLAKTHTVLAPDIRGHGESDRPTDPAFYGRKILTDVQTLLETEGHEAADVAGFSMGAELALAFAVFHPQCVRRLVIAGSGWSPPGIVDEYRKWFDVLAASSRSPDALRALIDGVPEFTGLPQDRIARLRMPLHGIIGALDDERPYMERIRTARPGFEPTVLDGLDHRGTWESAEFADFVVCAFAITA